MKNLHKYYYRDYFTGIPFNYLLTDSKASETTVNEIKRRNDIITDSSVSLRDNTGWRIREGYMLANDISPDDPDNRFSLVVQYPGLITGIGISHEVKIEGEFKLGMHFDWTYGMPIVYGSSVKGVLRAWFREFYKGELDPIDLMMDIFSGACERDIKAEQERYGNAWERKVRVPENRIYKKHKSIYDRDVFFDAVIVKPDRKGRILCSDSITPHGNNPLKNPTPLTFLKIAPGCEIQFRFKLVNTKIGNLELTRADKIHLFQTILTTVGIGAKTNVGYGQLAER